MRDQKVTHVHVTNIYQASPPAPLTPPPPISPRPPRPSEMPAHLRKPSSQAQRDLLMLLVEMRPNDRVVLDFMEREFGFRMVIDLDELQLKRTRRYAEAVQARATRPRNNKGRAPAQHREFL